MCATYEEDDAYLRRVVELMELELPHVTKLAREGGTVFDFVQAHIHLAKLQGAPSHSTEGYLIVLHPRTPRWQLYRYAPSAHTMGGEPYRQLITKRLATARGGRVIQPVEFRRREFSRRFPELEELPTYFADVELNFPFKKTTLPVLKCMLLRALAA